MKTSRQSANLLLGFLALIALIAIIIIGYKIIDRLMRKPMDPYHGQGTNITDSAWPPRRIADLQAQGVTSVTVAGVATNLPVEQLQWQWHYTVQRSYNLVDWEDVDLDWDQITNDLSRPAVFYRKVVWW